MRIPNFSEKFDLVLKQKGMNQATLANLSGFTERHISRVKKTGNISDKFLDKICGILNIPHDFFTDDGKDDFDYYPIPFRYASGGMGGGSYEGSRKIISYVSLKKDFLLTKTNKLESLSFIRAIGDSMSPTIPPDASVLIDESQTTPINHKIYFILWNNEYYIKRLIVKDGRVIGLQSDNDGNIQKVGIDDNFQILGKAILQQSEL